MKIILRLLILPLLFATFAHGAWGADPQDAADNIKADPAMLNVIKTFEASTTDGPAKMPWRLFVPKTASKENPLPLIVFLHGAGRRGTDNIGPMVLAWPFVDPKAQAEHPCFVFAPQMGLARCWAYSTLFGPQQQRALAVAQNPPPITDEMAAALAMVDRLIKERPIDPHRVYIVGNSMGGIGTWDALTRRPDLWAAGLPICGVGDPRSAEKIKSIPVWAWHGENDSTIPVAGTRQIIAALTAAGAKPVYTEVPKGGHGVWVPAYADPKVHEWLFNQRKP